MPKKHTSPFIILSAGIVFGGVVGAAATLLAASKTGTETRADLVEKSEAIKSQAVTILKDSRASSAGFISRLRQPTGEMSRRTNRQNHRAAFTVPEIQIE